MQGLAKSFHLPKYSNGPFASVPYICRRIRVKDIQVVDCPLKPPTPEPWALGEHHHTNCCCTFLFFCLLLVKFHGLHVFLQWTVFL